MSDTADVLAGWLAGLPATLSHLSHPPHTFHTPLTLSGPFLGVSFMSILGCFMMSTFVKVGFNAGTIEI